MKTNAELIVEAREATDDADYELMEICERAQRDSSLTVPAEIFTNTRMKLQTALAAVTELEQRAKGVNPPREGEGQ